MIIKNAKIFTPEGRFEEGSIAFDQKITGIGQCSGKAEIDAQGGYVIPGLIDVHTHGAVGCDASDGIAENLPKLSRYYAQHGVTSFCPTTMTLKEPVLKTAVESIRGFQRPADGAKAAGIHLEGPFLSYAKRGAQAADNLHEPDVEMFHRLNEASGGIVRLVTVAPEEPNAMAFIREVSKVCTVSLGHSTADFKTACEAYENGASNATHLFNGMPALLHREPGIIGAALVSDASVELICDGLHIHPAVILAVHKMFGDRLTLISDSLRCAGMPDGDYELGGQPIVVKGGRATLLDGTLAGSSISMLDALRNVVRFGLPLEAAVTAATLRPAKVIRMEQEIGSLAVGRSADLLLLDPELNLVKTFIDGQEIQ